MVIVGLGPGGGNRVIIAESLQNENRYNHDMTTGIKSQLMSVMGEGRSAKSKRHARPPSFCAFGTSLPPKWVTV